MPIPPPACTLLFQLCFQAALSCFLTPSLCTVLVLRWHSTVFTYSQTVLLWYATQHARRTHRPIPVNIGVTWCHLMEISAPRLQLRSFLLHFYDIYYPVVERGYVRNLLKYVSLEEFCGSGTLLEYFYFRGRNNTPGRKICVTLYSIPFNCIISPSLWHLSSVSTVSFLQSLFLDICPSFCLSFPPFPLFPAILSLTFPVTFPLYWFLFPVLPAVFFLHSLFPPFLSSFRYFMWKHIKKTK